MTPAGQRGAKAKGVWLKVCVAKGVCVWLPGIELGLLAAPAAAFGHFPKHGQDDGARDVDKMKCRLKYQLGVWSECVCGVSVCRLSTLARRRQCSKSPKRINIMLSTAATKAISGPKVRARRHGSNRFSCRRFAAAGEGGEGGGD